MALGVLVSERVLIETDVEISVKPTDIHLHPALELLHVSVITVLFYVLGAYSAMKI